MGDDFNGLPSFDQSTTHKHFKVERIDQGASQHFNMGGSTDQEMPDQQRKRQAPETSESSHFVEREPGITLDAAGKSLVDDILDSFKTDTLAAMDEANTTLKNKLDAKIESTLRRYDKAIQQRFNIIDEDLFGLKDQVSKLEAENRKLWRTMGQACGPYYPAPQLPCNGYLGCCFYLHYLLVIRRWSGC